MNTVYKYQLERSTTTILSLPEAARLLKVETQNGEVVLWALVSTDAPSASRIIEVYGTGHPIQDPEGLVFINTFLVNGGTYVFHAFERV